MAASKKVSGKLTGNNLNISISTNDSGNKQQSMESSANKVKSISEISSKAEKQTTLNKKQISKSDKSDKPSSVQELQILQSIDKKLQDLNNNIIKIQTLKDSPKKEENVGNKKEAEVNIFDKKFIEGTNQSFIDLFNNTNFRTRLKSVFSEIYEDSPLLKITDLDTFKSEILEVISSNSYTVSNNEKAVDQEKYVNLSKETLGAINKELSNSNTAIETGSAKDYEKIGESIKAYTEQVEASTALNTASSDAQQNAINELLKERSEKVSSEKSSTENVEKNITNQAIENDTVDSQKEKKEIGESVESKVKDLEKSEEKTASENDEFINQLNEKLDVLNDSLTENKESIDELIEERIIDRELKNASKEEMKIIHEERKKAMMDKSNKSNSVLGIIKNSLSSAGNSIKNVGKSIALSKPISKVRNIFQKDSSKNGVQRLSQVKKGEQKLSINKKSTPEDLMKEQKTVSGVDKATNLRNIEKNSKSFLMGQDMKKTGSLGKSSGGKSPISELVKISTILSGFLLFYKGMAKKAEEKELFKLRFGESSGEKPDTGMWSKFLSAFKFKKEKPKEKIKEESRWWWPWINRINTWFSWRGFKNVWRIFRKTCFKRFRIINKTFRKGIMEINNMGWKICHERY